MTVHDGCLPKAMPVMQATTCSRDVCRIALSRLMHPNRSATIRSATAKNVVQVMADYDDGDTVSRNALNQVEGCFGLADSEGGSGFIKLNQTLGANCGARDCDRLALSTESLRTGVVRSPRSTPRLAMCWRASLMERLASMKSNGQNFLFDRLSSQH